MSLTKEFKSYLENNFYLDVRSMALFRALIGMILLSDLCFRFSIVEQFYLSSGIIPQYLDVFNLRTFSIFHFFDSSFSIKAVISLQVLASIFLIIGFKTRFFAGLSYLFLLFLHRKNMTILNGGDDLLLCILLLMVVLPIHTKHFVDALSRKEQENNQYFDYSTLLFFVQILIVYLTTTAYKDSREWYIDFTAIEVAFQLDQFVTSIGRVFNPYPSFLKILTIGSIMIEGVLPLIFLIPRLKSYVRDIVVTIFITFHLGIELTLDIGHFSYISIAMWTALYTDNFWCLIERKFKIKQLFRFNSKERNKKLIKNNRVTQIISVYFIFHLIITAVYPLMYQRLYPEIPKNGLGTIYEISEALGIEQEWKMFSPAPTREDYWFVAEILYDGVVEKNLLNTSNKKPKDFKKLYPNRAWRKFSRKMYQSRKLGIIYAEYLCRKNNIKGKIIRITRYQERYEENKENIISSKRHVEMKCPEL